jgi:hypothetical protein
MEARMADEYLAQIRKILAERGITTFQLLHRRKHRQAVFPYRGKNFTITFPSSPSDVRGPRNMTAEIRRMLRIKEAREPGVAPADGGAR